MKVMANPSPTVKHTYPYQPLLEPDGIRLLVLEPATTDDVQCSLIHATLSDCNSDMVDHFIALSYVWGEQNLSSMVRVDGHLVAVTANLLDALSHIRHATRPFRIWADALCINQEDDQEKGSQVTMMMRIYKAAFRTIIYLGTPSFEGVELSDWGVLPQEPAHSEVLQKKTCRELLNRPWFRRVWVEQELVSSRDPWVQYGQRRFHWDHLCAMMISSDVSSGIVLSNRDKAKGPMQTEDLPSGDTLKEDRAGYEHFIHLRLARTMYYQSSNVRNTMFELLQSRGGVEATNPRDLIFAHSGISSDGLHPSLAVDYSKSCKELFEDFALYQIRSSGNFGIFSCIDHTSSPGLEGLATWAPNWIAWKKPPILGLQSLWNTDRRDYYDIFTEKKPISQTCVTYLGQSTISCLANLVGVITYISVPLYEAALRIDGAKQNTFSGRLIESRNDFIRELESGGIHGWKREPFAVLCDDIYNAWREAIHNDKLLPPLSEVYSDPIAREKIFYLAYRLFDPDLEKLRIQDKGRIRYHKDQTLSSSPFYILFMYFLPGFDRQAVGSTALAVSTIDYKYNSIILTTSSTKVGDGVLIPYPPDLQHLYYVIHPESEDSETDHLVYQAKKSLRRVWTKPPRSTLSINDIGISWMRTREGSIGHHIENMTSAFCSLVGEAHGISMTKDPKDPFRLHFWTDYLAGPEDYVDIENPFVKAIGYPSTRNEEPEEFIPFILIIR